MQQATVTILDPVGLHARPAALLVQTAGRYRSQVRLLHGTRRADARSIIQLLSLGVRQGSDLTVTVEGSDEVEALAAVLAVLSSAPGSYPPPASLATLPPPAPGATDDGSAKKERDDEKAD